MVNKITRLLLLIVLLFAAFGNVVSQSQSQADKKRILLKTALIYKFTQNVFWPNEDQMKEFVIVVIASPKLTEAVSMIPKVKKFRDRVPIRVVSVKNINDMPACQMLVIDGSRDENYWALYSKIRAKKVLMVAENMTDFKKSMISFTQIGDNIKYITNRTKLEESGLAIKKALYEGAIQKEGEWKSIIEKMQDIVKNGSKTLDKSDVKQMLSAYKDLEEQKKENEAKLARVSDSLNTYSAKLNAKIAEEEIVSKRIEEQERKAEQLDKVIKQKEVDINEKDKTLKDKDRVILIIAALSLLGIILLLFSIRSNNQRRKANKLLSQQKSEIERQKHLVDEKQKEILDSINYAKRIQTALMANSKMMNENLPEHFVFFKPKDIVAGDFYWASPVEDGFVYITADSTGHGVPGAFMSLLNISKLNDAINKNKSRPDLVLNEVKDGIIKALNPEGSQEESKDGMDAILCKLDHKNMKLQYAAANNSFCIIRGRDVITCKADKMPVGKSHDDSSRFTFNELQLERGDMIYTFTDGYGDQFGGPEGKKFKHKNLRDVLLEVSALPVVKQKEIIANRFEDWKGDLEQVDDVLIIGVRV
jgi:serine phosphatase RsbU (regulator of sigma subunit)